MYRHGDLLIKKVDNLPKKVRPYRNNVLAFGEVTGHKHQLLSKQQLVYEQDNTKYLSIKKSTKLIHEEHDTIVLEQGNYVVLQEREYDVFAQEIKQVLD